MNARQVGRASAVVLILSTLAPTPAQAYLDPGTGSMILQSIIGAIAGGLVLLKIYWEKIRHLFSTKPRGQPVEEEKTE